MPSLCLMEKQLFVLALALLAQKNFTGRGEPALGYISSFSQSRNGASFCLHEVIVQRCLWTRCAECLPSALLGFVVDGTACLPSLSGLRPNKGKKKYVFLLHVEKVQQV